MELAEEVVGELPANIRKVFETAAENGWELNGKGASFCLRLDHPTDDLAVPCYITWQITESDKGNLSWRFMSAATATLQPLNYSDLLNYLKDPTIIYPEASDV